MDKDQPSIVKRDITVWISLVMVLVAGALALAMGMPRHLGHDDPVVFHVLFWLIMLGSVRATVLWFQTLIHGVKHAKEENRVAVVLGHFFLGPIMAYGYFLASRMDANRLTGQPPVLTGEMRGER